MEELSEAEYTGPERRGSPRPAGAGTRKPEGGIPEPRPTPPLGGGSADRKTMDRAAQNKQFKTVEEMQGLQELVLSAKDNLDKVFKALRTFQSYYDQGLREEEHKEEKKE